MTEPDRTAGSGRAFLCPLFDASYLSTRACAGVWPYARLGPAGWLKSCLAVHGDVYRVLGFQNIGIRPGMSESGARSDQIAQIPIFQPGSDLLESLWNIGICSAVPRFQLGSDLLESLWNLGISQENGGTSYPRRTRFQNFWNKFRKIPVDWNLVSA